MAMEDEYDPFDEGGQGYVSEGGSGKTAAETFGYDSGSVFGGGGDDGGNDFNPYRANPGAGLSRNQFNKTYGLSARNPYGNTGFTNFFDKISKALGGKGVDYSQQMRAMQPRGTVFQGGIISEGGVNKGMSSQDYMDTYGTPAEQIMQQQYDAYRNPFNQPDLDGYDPDYATATAEEMAQGKITRQGRTDRGSFLGPLEEVKREQSIGDMVARAMMPMGTGMLDTTDTYLSSQVTPEMRARSSENPLASAFQALSGVDMKQAQTKVNQGINSLGDRLSALASGSAPQAAPTSTVPTPTFDPREMDATAQPGRPTLDDLRAALPLDYEENVGNPNYLADNDLEMKFFVEGSNLPENQQFNRDAIEQAAYEGEPIFRSTQNTGYDEVPTSRPISGPIAMPENVKVARTVKEEMRQNPFATMFERMRNEGSGAQVGDMLVRPDEFVAVDIETPRARPDMTSPAFEQEFFTRTNFQDPDMDANASYRASRATPVGPDMDALGSTIDPRGNQMAPTPGEGYGMFGPRTPEDLRSMGIEPTAQDLMDMQLSPAEILREQARGMDTSYQGTGLPSDLRQADQVGATAASTSLENFFEQNPDLGASLMNSREGAELNDLVGRRNAGGFDKSKPIQTFIDPETAEIRVQGYDARTGGAKGFNIDASDFFGKQSFGEVLLDTLQGGGVEKLADESLAEKARRQNREFQEEKARREREGRPSINTLEQGLGNISFNRG